MNDLQTVRLERLKAVLFHRLDALRIGQVTEVEFSEHLRYLCDDMQVRVKYLIYGINEKPTVVRYPADWWQAFKKEVLPPWIQRRLPSIKYSVVTVEKRTTYPTLRLSTDEHVPVVCLNVVHGDELYTEV